MKLEAVQKALAEQVPSIQGHLDLEGFAYIKVTRTGKDDCFAGDATMDVLTRRAGCERAFTVDEVAALFWKKPAKEKWEKP